MRIPTWLAMTLIVAGASVLLFAPIAHMEAVVDFPPSNGPPTFESVDVHMAPWETAIALGSLLMVVVGLVLLFRKSR